MAVEISAAIINRPGSNQAAGTMLKPGINGGINAASRRRHAGEGAGQQVNQAHGNNIVVAGTFNQHVNRMLQGCPV